jgi:hypothetical protein
MRMMTKVNSGEWWARDWRTGRLTPAAPATPDVVICRRVADYPGGRAPAGATLGTCGRCAAPLAHNAAKYPEVERICMQCAHIVPLPFPQ